MSWADEEGGVSAHTHAEYLRKFCDWFYSSVVRQVDGAVKQRLSLAQDSLVTEAMQVRDNELTPRIMIMTSDVCFVSSI